MKRYVELSILIENQIRKIEENVQTISMSSDLLDNLRTMYEWEYKAHKILGAKKIIPKRKDNILIQINKRMRPILDDVSSKLGEVFSHWLKLHDLDNPRNWAEARIKEIIDIGEEMSIDTVKHEYNRYNRIKDWEFVEEFLKVSQDYINPNAVEEEIQYRIDDLSEDGEDGESLEDIANLNEYMLKGNYYEYMIEYLGVEAETVISCTPTGNWVPAEGL